MTETATLEINDLIGYRRKNNHAARAARFSKSCRTCSTKLVQFLDVVSVCQMTR